MTYEKAIEVLEQLKTKAACAIQEDVFIALSIAINSLKNNPAHKSDELAKNILADKNILAGMDANKYTLSEINAKIYLAKETMKMKNEIFPVDAMGKTCEESYFSFPLKIFVLSVIMFLSFVEMVVLSLAALCFILGDLAEFIIGLNIPGKMNIARTWCASVLRDFIVTMRIILITFKAWSDESWAFRAEIVAADKYIED